MHNYCLYCSKNSIILTKHDYSHDHIHAVHPRTLRGGLVNPPRRLRGTFGMCNLREGFVNLREGFVVAPWRLREAFSKTRSAKASRGPLEGFAKAPRAPSFGNDSSDSPRMITHTYSKSTYIYVPYPYFGLACDHGNSFLCLEE